MKTEIFISVFFILSGFLVDKIKLVDYFLLLNYNKAIFLFDYINGKIME